MEQQNKSDIKKYVTKQVDYWLQPENLKLVEEWAEKGLVIEQVAKNMGIVPSTLYKWRIDHPQLNDAWMKGKSNADMQVVNAMFRAAVGYKTTEVTRELNEYGELIVTKEVDKEISPNASMNDKWLRNRMPELFKDNQLIDYHREKVKAETERIKEQTELIKLQKAVLKGDVKDTGHLAALASLFKSE